MSLETQDHSLDLIRWTFTVDPAHIPAIEAHLGDLGADVWVRDEGKFQVTWEEPEEDLDGVIEAIWAIHGSPFDVTQEEFHRVGLHVLQQDSGDLGLEAA